MSMYYTQKLNIDVAKLYRIEPNRTKLSRIFQFQRQHGHQDEGEGEAPGGEAPQELGCQEEGEAEERQAGHLCDPQEEDRYLWLDSWFNPN